MAREELFVTMTIRTPVKLWRALRKQAAENSRSLTAEVVHRLKKDISQEPTEEQPSE